MKKMSAYHHLSDVLLHLYWKPEGSSQRNTFREASITMQSPVEVPVQIVSANNLEAQASSPSTTNCTNVII